MLKQIYNGFVDLVYPPLCLQCKSRITQLSSTDFLCLACIETIPKNIPPFCPKCSRHLGQANRNRVCKTCQKTEFHFDFAWAACLYEDPLKKLLYSYKYHQKTLVRHTFTDLMNNFIKMYQLDINQFDSIMPIPLHPTRLRERGYNQSLLLAQIIAREHDIKLSLHNLIRTQYTPPQISLKRKERFTNIQGAFKIKQPKSLRQKNILLVDDLLTTGATASEAAKTLKKAGAKQVAIFTLAIA